MIDELDFHNNHVINYSEFLAGTLSIQSILTVPRLEALFKQFDINNTDEISAQNIKDAMTKLGREIPDQEIQLIMKKHDLSGDQKIQFDEFRKMMLDLC